MSASDMKKVCSVILCGGEGTRLHPLTLSRAKPSINFGGSYRLIDIPLSFSLHANCLKTFVVTQFFSSSLHDHIFQTYMQGQHSGKIEILTAEQKPSQKNWFQGTADAVRQNLGRLLEFPCDYFLILSGDQVYDFSFEKMLQTLIQTKSDAVIASIPLPESKIKGLGLLKVDEEGIIRDFYEKPDDKNILKNLKHTPSTFKKLGIQALKARPYLGSMGIYLFKRKVLSDLLRSDLREDFGKHLIPSLIKNGRVATFIHGGYWEDIGTISTFYQANMHLTEQAPPFQLYDEARPILTAKCHLPPPKIFSSKIDQTLLSKGVFLDRVKISKSIIGPRSKVLQGTKIEASYLMGSDYYTKEIEGESGSKEPLVGPNCHIKRAIIDKNVRIGSGVKLLNLQNLSHFDGENVFIRDGIIIVPKGADLPDGFVL